MAASAAELAATGYFIQRNVLDPDAVGAHFAYALACADANLLRPGDSQVPDAPVAYGDQRMDSLLETLRPVVEQTTGLRLWPTYSYFRVYRRGNLLRAHRDRPACEISVTLNLGMDASGPWPIWIAGPVGVASVSLSPGDALIYRGCDCYHWREPFEGDRLVQVFLHYVDRDGPHAEWKFDKRPTLAGSACP